MNELSPLGFCGCGATAYLVEHLTNWFTTKEFAVTLSLSLSMLTFDEME